jgi:hypothetical protein
METANHPERDEFGRIVEEPSITEDQYNALFEDSSEGPDNAEDDNESNEQSGTSEPDTAMAEPTAATKVDSPPVIRKPILTILAEPPKPLPVQKAPVKIDLDKEMSTIKYADGINPVSLPVIKQARAEGRAPPAVEIVEDDEPKCTTQPMSANAIKRLESREASKHYEQSETYNEPYTASTVKFAELESSDRLENESETSVSNSRLRRSESFNNGNQSALTTIHNQLSFDQRHIAEVRRNQNLRVRFIETPTSNHQKREKYKRAIQISNLNIQAYEQGVDPEEKATINKGLEHLLKGMHMTREQFAKVNQPLDPHVIYVEMQNFVNEICMYNIKTSWQDCNQHFGTRPENYFRDQHVLQIVSTLGPQKIGILFYAHPDSYNKDLDMLKSYIKDYALEEPFNMKIDIRDMIVANGKFASLLIITSHYVKDYATKDQFVKGLYDYICTRSEVCDRLLVTAKKHPTIADAVLFPLMIRRNMSTADVERVESDGRVPSINFIGGAKEVNLTFNNKNKVSIDNSTTNNNNTVNIQGDNNGTVACGGTVSDLITDNKSSKTANTDRCVEFFQNLDIDRPLWAIKGAQILFSDLRAYYDQTIKGKASVNNFAKMLVDSGKYEKMQKHPTVNGKRVTMYIRL